MYPKTDWAELFLSSTGRAKNTPFIIAICVLLLATKLYESVINGPLVFVLGWVVYPAFFFSAACVLSKRLHDRGRSGWWSAIILVAMIMVWPNPDGFFDFIAVMVLVWATVELVLMPPERGDNRYGPRWGKVA
jgi:uncharacterized membrane protein YhaH (DUF805 family)